jgi:hypothetical protein
MTATYDPTPAPQLIQWLDLAARLQLERDLADLPTLAELLDRNYFHLLAKGDRNPLDSAVRYVVKFDALDLADRRVKWAHAEGSTEPLTLADRDIASPSVDPAWWSRTAKMNGRRQGILPTLAGWVSLAAGEMHDVGAWHFEPTDPDRIVWVATTCGQIHATKPGPTVASEAGWLLRHFDWICGQQWVVDMADELRRIVGDLATLGITFDPPHHHATMTADQLRDADIVSKATVYRWFNAGLLSDVGKVDRKRVFVVHEVKALVDNPPWDRQVRTLTLEEITTTFGVSATQ